MSLTRLVTTVVVCLAVSPNVCFGAQPQSFRFEGKVVIDQDADRLTVDIHENGGPSPNERAVVQRDGTFYFSGVPGTQYQFRVMSAHGDRLYMESWVLRHGDRVELRLTSLPGGRSVKPGGAVSLLRLSHKPVKAAMKLHRAAESFAANGNPGAAVDSLKKAVDADPKWFEAWNNLGGQLLAMSRYEEAAEAFRQAVEIDSRVPASHSNLGLALLCINQPARAEEEGRRAMQLDPTSGKAAYVTGVALLNQRKKPAEALALLEESTKEVPRALLTIAEWYCRNNDLKSCQVPLQTYLKTPLTPHHERARAWLAEVNRNLLLH